MTIRKLAFAASLLAAAAPALGQAPPDNAGILAAAQAFDDAQVHGDRAVLERMLAADYLLAQGSGKIGDRKDLIDGFTDPKLHLDPFQVVDRLFVRPSPDTAIVGGEARVQGTEQGKPFRQHFRYSDFLARRNGQWVVVYTQMTPLPLP